MMTNRLLLCLLIVCIATDLVCCKFRIGGSRSRSGGSSSRWGGGGHSSYKPSSSWSFGSSWKPSSSSGHSYPSSSSGFSGSSSPSRFPSSGSGKPSYPTSSSGLSGLSLPSIFSSTGSGKPSYPSSSSGLSGSSSPSRFPSSGQSGYGSSKPSYPSSPTGLSGSGNIPSYPSTSWGLSGYGSKKPSNPPSLSGSDAISRIPSYPPAPTGLSGSHSSSSKHSYPTTQTGYSGTGLQNPTGSQKPIGWQIPTGSHGPSSGNNFKRPTYDTSFRPSNAYNTHNSYGSGSYAHGHVGNTHTPYVLPPNYQTHPHYVYVTEYRNSGSRYGDILTGLALYNMGRSHSSYHHDHYYYDDYYRRRYNSNSYTNSKPSDNTVVCTLRVKENGKLEILKIPCEIVSTFGEEGNNFNYTQTQKNTTTCITQITTNNVTTHSPVISENSTEKAFAEIQNTTLPSSINETTTNQSKEIPVNSTALVETKLQDITSNIIFNPNYTMMNLTNYIDSIAHISGNTTTNAILPNVNYTATNVTNHLNTSSHNITNTATNISLPIISLSSAPKDTNDTQSNGLNTAGNITMVNVTTCTTVSELTDPLKVKGPPANVTNMECAIDIVTKKYSIRNNVDCNMLLKYAKKSEKPDSKIVESPVLPSRSKLKSWLDNPPWWVSLFIAV